jgi:hypothetical protein
MRQLVTIPYLLGHGTLTRNEPPAQCFLVGSIGAAPSQTATPHPKEKTHRNSLLSRSLLSRGDWRMFEPITASLIRAALYSDQEPAALRTQALAGTELETAQCDTLPPHVAEDRSRGKRDGTQGVDAFSESYPYQELFAYAYQKLIGLTPLPRVSPD